MRDRAEGNRIRFSTASWTQNGDERDAPGRPRRRTSVSPSAQADPDELDVIAGGCTSILAQGRVLFIVSKLHD